MKKKISYLIIFLAFFLIGVNVEAATKVWSDKDGLSSGLVYPDTDIAFSYPMKVVKADDAICDDFPEFADDDNSSDFIFYHYDFKTTENILYETKFDKSVIDGSGNTIHFADPSEDDLYWTFLDDFTHYTVPDGTVDGFMPVVVEYKSGGYELRYISIDSSKNIGTELINWKNKKDLTDLVVDEYLNGLSYKKIEEIKETDESIKENPENNKLDAIGEPVAEQGYKDQVAVSKGGKKTQASRWKSSDGNSEKFLGKIYNMLRILVPLIVIIFSIVDYLKVFFTEEEKVYKQAFNKFVKRIIIGIILFVVPALISLIFDIAGFSESGIEIFDFLSF